MFVSFLPRAAANALHGVINIQLLQSCKTRNYYDFDAFALPNGMKYNSLWYYFLLHKLNCFPIFQPQNINAPTEVCGGNIGISSPRLYQLTDGVVNLIVGVCWGIF